MNLRILLTPMLSFGRIRAALRKRHPEGIDAQRKVAPVRLLRERAAA